MAVGVPLSWPSVTSFFIVACPPASLSLFLSDWGFDNTALCFVCRVIVSPVCVIVTCSLWQQPAGMWKEIRLMLRMIGRSPNHPLVRFSAEVRVDCGVWRVICGALALKVCCHRRLRACSSSTSETPLFLSWYPTANGRQRWKMHAKSPQRYA